MKILAIRGRNLASLARAFEVDLAHGPLAGVGLFAITGPVGAGKSTLLDALCLPLFDRTPRLSGRGGAFVGDDGDDRDGWLRAHDPRTLLRRDALEAHAEVDFVGRDGMRYRAAWSVRRARRRPDGRVQEQELVLTDLDRGLVVASGRRSEVLASVQARLGLDFAQFCRSVLLAQGDFAAFLRATADERAKLLETLTGADVYRRLSKAAHERARQHANDVALLRAQLDAQAPMATGERAAAEGRAAQLAQEAGACRLAIAIASRYVTWHEAAEQHRQRESEATVQLQAAIRAHDAAAARRELLARRQRAIAVVARHEVAAAAEQQAAASAAAAAGAKQRQRVAEQQAAVHAERSRRAWTEAFGGGGEATAMPAIVRDYPNWEPLLRQWQDAEVQLASWRGALPKHEEAVATASRQLAAVVRDSEAAARTLLSANAALEAARTAAAQFDHEALADRRRRLDEQRARSVAIAGIAAAWQRAEQGAEQARARCAAVETARAAALQAVAAATAARADVVRAGEAARERAARAQQQAGLAALRAELVDGEPCPLCGADAHPAAAAPPPDESVAAETAARQAEQALQARERELASRQGELQAMEREREAAAAAQRRGDDDVVASRAAWAAAASAEASTTAAARTWLATQEAALAATGRELEAAAVVARDLGRALEAAVRNAGQASAAWQQVEQRRRQAETAAQHAARARDDAVVNAEREAARLADARTALAAACAGLAGGVDALAALAGDRTARLRALHDHERARAAAGQAAAAAAGEAARLADAARRDADASASAAHALQRALAVAGVELADVLAARELGAEALAAEAAALRELADAVERHRTILQERVGLRRQHETQEHPTLDAGEAAAALRDARASFDGVERELQAVQLQLHADDLIRRQRDELAPRLAAAERDYATWQALDDLIGSSTGDEFAVFAQGLTLDLLLLEANRRLAELARRYRLQKNTDPEARLDFVVVDLDLGGSRRSLHTLSGGETFLVSLALALALATLAAPKSRVETLFLDEGFGTLDAQSLEVALGALDSLQATGCQVGVISHVDGIAERIGAQVVVQPEGGGQSRVFAQAR